ncbi:O-antigen polysaccharide polymerase Wzy family protein [Vibrio sp. NC2]|uniref:O-antigen polysaccharide polymerase Wzy family protein n=1 Tax=Vibrio sp. NC2 TaxID=2974562 RepID=UPI0021A468E2|nr:O-antigen polysaccharide polymerase Wzy family protein [Vibrio sp. NC2]MCT4349532.1 O-antigen polysaccharide polymerase Wzy family protein [Vibrio sp. NC2]
MNLRHLIYVSIYVLILTILVFSLVLSDLDVSIISLLFSVFVIMSIFILTKVGYVFFSIPIVFVLFFSLFVGGRFLGCAISVFNGFSVCPADYKTIFEQERMVQTSISMDQANYILIFVFLWIAVYVLTSAILMLTQKSRVNSSLTYVNECHPVKSNKMVTFFLLTSLFLMLSFRLQDIVSVLRGGYLALYMRGDDSYFLTLFKNIVFTLFIVSFSILFSENKKAPFVYFILFLALLDIVVGQRGAFFSKMVILAATSRRLKDISLVRAFFLVSILILIVNFIMNFSLRVNLEKEDSINLIEVLGLLLYSQGTTLGIIGFSIFDVSDVPLRLAIKSFIPFTNTIYTSFGGNIEFYERSIGQFISYLANSKAYELGGGLGSSIVSESYLIFGFFGSIFFAAFLGYVSSIVESRRNISVFVCYIWLNVMYVTPMLSRSGISNVMVPIFLASTIYLIYKSKFNKGV